MSNVKLFPGVTPLDFDADVILNSAVGKLNSRANDELSRLSKGFTHGLEPSPPLQGLSFPFILRRQVSKTGITPDRDENDGETF